MPPYHWWRTVFWLIPLIGLATIVLGLCSLVAALCGQPNICHRCAQWWGRFILRTTGVRLEHHGAPLPPPHQGCIFVANHASFYDIPVVFTAVPRQLRIMAKRTLVYVPFIGWHLKLAGHLLVDRANPGNAIFKRMRRLAASGASLIVFPEGGRTPDGELLKFKAGVFLLAIETGLPIVPIALDGTRDVMPPGRLMACPATVRVTVHPPIVTTGMSRGDARGLALQVRSLLQSDLRREGVA